MLKSNCALDEDSANITVVGSRTKLGVPALTVPLQHTSLNVGYQVQVSRAHTAGSDWFKRKKEKKVTSLLRGSCSVELRFGQRRGCLAVWWKQLLLTPSHILDVTRPQTNSDSVCVVSRCAGQVLFDKVYLLVKWTCASTKNVASSSAKFERDLQCSAYAWNCGHSSVYTTNYATWTVIM